MKKSLICILLLPTCLFSQYAGESIYAFRELRSWYNPSQLAFNVTPEIALLSKNQKLSGGEIKAEQLLMYRGKPFKRLNWDIQLANRSFFIEKTNHLGIGLAYSVKLNQKSSLAFGLRSKVNFHQLKVSNLKVFEDDMLIQSDVSGHYFSFDVGLSYIYKRTTLNFSVNQLNINNPGLPVIDNNSLFYEDSLTLNTAIHIGLDHYFNLNEQWQLSPVIWYTSNTLYQDAFLIGLDFNFKNKLSFGLNGTKNNDIIFKAILTIYKKISFGFYQNFNNDNFILNTNEFLLIYSF